MRGCAPLYAISDNDFFDPVIHTGEPRRSRSGGVEPIGGNVWMG